MVYTFSFPRTFVSFRFLSSNLLSYLRISNLPSPPLSFPPLTTPSWFSPSLPHPFHPRTLRQRLRIAYNCENNSPFLTKFSPSLYLMQWSLQTTPFTLGNGNLFIYLLLRSFSQLVTPYIEVSFIDDSKAFILILPLFSFRRLEHINNGSSTGNVMDSGGRLAQSAT